MSDYRAPIQDALFTLRHLAMHDDIAATPRYAHADIDTVTAIATEQGRFMQEVFAPINYLGDQEGLTWSEEGVTTPEAFKPAYRKFVEAGWQGVGSDPEYGGADLPLSTYIITHEFTIAANAALAMCPGLTAGAIEALELWGTDEQKATYLPKMITGEWTGTMNLTEPQAGSDVGSSTTKAIRQDDGTYLITGTKIFISFGDHDLAENIIHLVLARTPDAPPGTKGISLFIVPKFLVNPDGSLGARNQVRCVSIEHKMGIHASPTCVLSYGDEGGAVGYLVGEERQGMKAMFTMMNSARVVVGLQGVSLADAAYQRAHEYAMERVQGRPLGTPADVPVPPIAAHPDVRRMLLTMRSTIEAMRAIVYHNAACLDLAHALEGDEATRWHELGDLLTPVSKGWCTDQGVDMTSLAIQVFGGMGYIEETGVAQYFRDARIAPIYEGTNGIQAMDLIGRKMPMRGGAVFTEFLATMNATADELEAAGEELAPLAAPLRQAVSASTEAATWLMHHGLADPRDALAGATPFLRLFGYTVAGWHMGRQALAAQRLLNDGGDDKEYLEAKLATARFFCTQLLPATAGLLPSITSGVNELDHIGYEALAAS